MLLRRGIDQGTKFKKKMAAWSGCELKSDILSGWISEAFLAAHGRMQGKLIF